MGRVGELNPKVFGYGPLRLGDLIGQKPADQFPDAAIAGSLKELGYGC